MWDFFKWIIGGMVTLLAICIGIIWTDNKDKHREAANDRDGLRREIRGIKDDSVGKTTLARVENDWRDELTSLRIDVEKKHEERKQDLKEKHEENKQYMSEIKRTIDDNEERDAKTRHDILDKVYAIGLQLAVLNSARRNDLEQR